MNDRMETMTELTLAIARAAALENPTFVVALGTLVRHALCCSADRPAVFEETLIWLRRFEEDVASDLASGRPQARVGVGTPRDR
jgi:hypothetical protein